MDVYLAQKRLKEQNSGQHIPSAFWPEAEAFPVCNCGAPGIEAVWENPE